MKNQIFNKALRVLLATNALILIAGAMLGPIYALFVEEIGGSLLDASIAGALFALTAGIVTLVSGKLSDRVRHSELVMILGYVLMGSGFFLYQFVDSVMFLFAVQVLIGFGEAVYSPAFDKLYSVHLDKGKSGTEWGAWEGMNYFTTAFGALVGGLIVTRYGFNAIFIMMAALSYISASYLYLLSPKRVL
ncbi:MFS transporter [Patescibacteria group bacterium]|nr:MFS transporter [Patescibacteria group bacterium]MBU1683514.1 MFS transporter [Patescibacteria group bacterium]MBU1935388.1 MFS transporter [Patescibacteria group bacterium]